MDIVAIELGFRRDPALCLDRVVADLAAALAGLGPVAEPVFEAPTLVHLALPRTRITLASDTEAGDGFRRRVVVSAVPLEGSRADRAHDVARTIARRIARRHAADRETWHNLQGPLDLASLPALSGGTTPHGEAAPAADLETLLGLNAPATARPAIPPRPRRVRPAGSIGLRRARPAAAANDLPQTTAPMVDEARALREALVRGLRSRRAGLAHAGTAGRAAALGGPLAVAISLGGMSLWLTQAPTAARAFAVG
ncbi:hypothetical protein GCM10011392_18100 [Wenxinia marina]|nr:hypothetical protein GCM10011392_18100 [Wenxinia marina]